MTEVDSYGQKRSTVVAHFQNRSSIQTALTRQMSGVRISQRPPEKPRFTTGF